MLKAKRSENRESKKIKCCNDIEATMNTTPSIRIRLPITQLLNFTINNDLSDLIRINIVIIKKSRPIRNIKFK
jgi:hypothetical protein